MSYKYILNVNVFAFRQGAHLLFIQATEAKRAKLTAEERESKLGPLQTNGWTMVDGRDAIYKEFLFKNFNEV